MKYVNALVRTGATATIERRVQRIIFCYEHARRILELSSNSTTDEQHSFAEWARIALEYGPKTNACDIYITIKRTFMYYFDHCPRCHGSSSRCTECNGRGVVMKKKEDFPKTMQHLYDALHYYITVATPIRKEVNPIAIVGHSDLPEYYFSRPVPSKIKPAAYYEPGDKATSPSSFTLKISEKLKQALANMSKPDQIIYGGFAGGKTYRFWQILFFMAKNGYDMSKDTIRMGGKEISYEEALKTCPYDIH